MSATAEHATEAPRSTPPTIHRGAAETRLDVAPPPCTCAPDCERCTCARARALASLHHRAG